MPSRWGRPHEDRSVIEVELHAGKDVPATGAERAREEIASLARYVDADRLQGARVTVRREHARAKHPYVVDAVVRFDGRPLRAHTSGRTPDEAAKAAAKDLRRQLRRRVDKQVALRDDPRVVPPQ
jgi:ribosome-associated translation inhibitor RaiA